MDLNTAIDAGVITGKVRSITGSTSDGAAAAAYGVWVKSITGKYPHVVVAGNNKARIVMDSDQIKAMQTWIQSATAKSLFGKEVPSVRYEFGPVVNPLLVKYLVPAGALMLVSGWLLRGWFD